MDGVYRKANRDATIASLRIYAIPGRDFANIATNSRKRSRSSTRTGTHIPRWEPVSGRRATVRCHTVEDVASPRRRLLHSHRCLSQLHDVHDDDDDDGDGDDDGENEDDEGPTVTRVRRTDFAAADATHLAARVRTEGSVFT